MKNRDSEHDFDSIADLLDQHIAMSEVVLRHLADVKAMLIALISRTLSDEDFRSAEKIRGDTWREIYKEMTDEAKRHYLYLRNLD